MAPVIRIDDQVMDELKKRAIALGLVFEPPNTTLRRVLGLNLDAKALVDKIVENHPTEQPVEPKPFDVKKFVDDILKKYAENKNVIELKLNPSSRECLYIPLPKDKRGFFPDYKVSFELIMDGIVFKAHVPYRQNAGGHIRGGFGKWYPKHPELKAGDRLRIEALEPGKRYKLSIVSKGV